MKGAQMYKRIRSLREYLLVAQDETRIEQYTRNEDGTWTLAEVGAGGVVRLTSLGVELAVDAVYRDPLAA